MVSLDARQIARFQEDGFLVVERLIEPDLADGLAMRFDALFAGRFETGVQPDEVNWQEETGDPTLTRQVCNGWKADRKVAEVVLRADIGQAIASLAGWRGCRLVQDNVIAKPAGARSIGFHRDNAYLAWYRPREMLSCWIALAETSAEGGTLELVRGSHRWPQTAAPDAAFHAPDDPRAPMTAQAAAIGETAEVVPIVVPKGGGAFHHGWTWHGSDRNRCTQTRRSLVIHGAPSEARFVLDRLSEGNGPIYGRYRRLGNDDTMDENHFPILWRDDGYRSPGLDNQLASGTPTDR